MDLHLHRVHFLVLYRLLLSVGYLLIHYRTRQESDIYCSKVFNNALHYFLLFNLATYKLTIFYILHQVSVTYSIRNADFLSANKLPVLVWNTMRQFIRISLHAWECKMQLQMPLTKRMKKVLGGDANTARWRSQKFCPAADLLPGARDGQNLISWRWSLPLPTNPVW